MNRFWDSRVKDTTSWRVYLGVIPFSIPCLLHQQVISGCLEFKTLQVECSCLKSGFKVTCRAGSQNGGSRFEDVTLNKRD